MRVARLPACALCYIPVPCCSVWRCYSVTGWLCRWLAGCHVMPVCHCLAVRVALYIASDRRACRVVGIVSGIVPGVNRNSGESLAIGIAAADEIGESGIVRHY
jgi:hypothetical protein